MELDGRISTRNRKSWFEREEIIAERKKNK